jgi:hypothetical protein
MTRYSRNAGDHATPNSNHITDGTLQDDKFAYWPIASIGMKSSHFGRNTLVDR